MTSQAGADRNSERFLITGAKGFIGAWVSKVLLEEGVEPWILDIDAEFHRLSALLSSEQLARLRLIPGDVTRLDDVERAVADNGITHIIHLAALQVPFCVADPPKGALVNVVGTVNMFEAAKRHRDHVCQVVYASSAAVYGPEEFYGFAQVPEGAPLQPTTLYGVYKQCNEGTARIYNQNDGISSIALRPSTVYGVGRDQGMTSGPTKAIKACVVGRPYTIAFTGRVDMQYVRDTATTFIRAARSGLKGARVYAPRGAVVGIDEVLAALKAMFPQAGELIRAEGKPLPLPSDVDDSALRRDFSGVPATTLEDGIRETAEIFRRLQRENRLDTRELGA
ncbi:MAG TPA: SDR family oxidoreductase [Terriglobia bacterium]|nr:SDR family oxidoreductase [Terriglobia bacterium]